jgi:hypothetical protein
MTEKERLAERLAQIRTAVLEQDLSEDVLANLSRQLDEITILRPDLRPRPAIKRLKGLGKDLWRSVDVDKYIRDERASWD